MNTTTGIMQVRQPTPICDSRPRLTDQLYLWRLKRLFIGPVGPRDAQAYKQQLVTPGPLDR